METSSIPSVLVVRSMCVDSRERANDSDATTADQHSSSTNNEHALLLSRIVRQTLLSLPLTCDITILPEIPVEPTTTINHGDSLSSYNHGPLSLTGGGHHSNDNRSILTHLYMERQGLHPCGMDNVFFLRDLPPAAADPASYLLSMTSCETTLTHLDTPNGVLELDPITVSIHPVPSTFLFAFENVATNTQGDDAILVNPRRASMELNVNFDFTVALDRLQGIVKDIVALRDDLWEKDEILSHETPSHETPSHETLSHETLSRETPPLHFQGTDEKCRTTKDHTYEGHHPTQYHDQLLHVLHELAEKESRHLDWMLIGLAFVFLLLMLHYARTVSPLIRSKQSLKKRKKATTFVDQSQSRASDADGVETEVKGNRPPVNSVTFKRQDASTQEVPALSFEPQEVIAASKLPVRATRWKPPFDAFESPIGRNESLSLSYDSPRQGKPVSFLPANYSPSWNDRELSPCSKLAQRWMQTKEERRVSRKDHTGTQPGSGFRDDEPDADRGKNMDCNTFAPKLPSLAHDPNAAELMNSAVCESETSPLVCRAVERKVATPETCLVSEESFLQDYWGE